MAEAVNITGRQFGRWTVQLREKAGGNHASWQCQCSCGQVRSVRSDALLRGTSVSCGCFQEDQASVAKRGAPGQVGLRLVHTTYRNRAKARGLEFTLTIEQVAAATALPCKYCGSPPSNTSRSKKHDRRAETTTAAVYLYSGLDRVDNAVGYTPGNIVPCCRMCNVAKNNHSLQAFQEWIRRLITTNEKAPTL